MMNVVVVGAGITGLSAAISLRRSGHNVTIYERSSLNNEIGAAINVPPNVARFLLPWGLDPKRARFVTSQAMYFSSPFTLEQFFKHDHSRNMEVYGAPLYYAHRVDLHKSLKRLATGDDGPGIPATIQLKSEVVGYDPETPSLTLADGAVVTADLIIAADGVHSIAAGAVTGKQSQPRPANHVNCCYRFLIPTAVLEANPATRFFIQEEPNDGVRVYSDVEGRRRLIAYPCRNYEIMNFVAICYNETINTKREDWHASIDKSEVLKKYAGFHPGLLAVIDQATEVKRWPLLYRPPLSTWHRGKLVLAGDAAHPMLPHHAQAGAQGIEDGLAIGLIMYGVTDASQIADGLKVYERVRYNRASFIQVMSNFGFDETPPTELDTYLEGRPVPKTVQDMLELTYRPDVVATVLEEMREIGPGFTLPADFFLSTSGCM